MTVVRSRNQILFGQMLQTGAIQVHFINNLLTVSVYIDHNVASKDLELSSDKAVLLQSFIFQELEQSKFLKDFSRQ